ncbi:MAG: homoserine dehydrogenase [Planctomycetota bacterium]
MTNTSIPSSRHASRVKNACRNVSGNGRSHFRVALLGLGTVGQGLCRLLEARRADLFMRHGISFAITHVLVRNRDEPRRTVPSTARLYTSAKAFLNGKFDVAVECMGGIEPALTLTTSLLERGIPVASANKALLAEHGERLLDLAEKHGTLLRFEASVAAGIPILGVIERALQSMTVTRICAILNGTSNFILTCMAEEGLSLEFALERAQKAGFAEADPSLDLNGTDAAQKLTVLARALGADLKTKEIDIQGMDMVDAEDCRQAKAFGFAMKPIAVADLTHSPAKGFVSPALIRLDHALAGVNGVANGVQLAGSPMGSLFFSGPGAGALPTAASIVDDLLILALERRTSQKNSRRRISPPRIVSRKRTGSASGKDQANEAPEPVESGPGSTKVLETGMAGHWFLSLRLRSPAGAVEDILDFLAASGVVFRSLQERRKGGKICLACITTTILKTRLFSVLNDLKEAEAIESYRAYPVVEPFGKEED